MNDDASIPPQDTARSAPAPGSPNPLSLGRATSLVAEREITTQVRSKPFFISLIVTIVLVVGGIVASGFFVDREESTPVAVVGIDDPAGSLPSETLDPTLAATMDEAETMLRDGDVEAIVARDADSPVGLTVFGLDEPPTDVAGLLSVAPPTETLDDSTDAPVRIVVAMAFGLVFMMLAISSGMTIVQNTIQEKQSRIVEILLSSISSRALLGGKILGNSALAVGQSVLIAAAASVALLASGRQELFDMLSTPMLWFVVFFIPGFVLVAAMFAAGAALVSRQEDSGAVVMPTMMLTMVPYFVVLFFYDDSTVMMIASYVPFSAPVAMPLRLFYGEALWFEPVLALLLLVLGAAALILIAARIYSRSLLKTGQRVSLRTALGSGP